MINSPGVEAGTAAHHSMDGVIFGEQKTHLGKNHLDLLSR